ncbi:hypothetical protein CONPUDRAFT_82013 [Coniophora puteana RWD-64-598 SS2]|uniref:Cofilin n=1 Tax=Coniophora puteana (strain RWD-64-598) TaxID=741705 RepID=A0A5M3MP61_CONPW|nr:uncharacterized protein CONPUDRAFT_82013 [Coniophora puteana RWD-64-598 SS2]EIW80883.1 hypothetical protein CONPUDRAFT_82013 [Coniophora puteana RWD-64-598 SS2]
MASGVSVDPACLSTYQALKNPTSAKKSGQSPLKYVLFSLNDKLTEIVVAQTAETGQDYDSFVKALPETHCRWAVFDFQYDQGEGQRNKLVFYSWSPDDAKIKEKMVYASSKDALRRALDGIQIEIQATAFDEVAEEAVLERITRGR